MKILVDLIPLKAGGGLQVALNFLEQLNATGGLGHEWPLLVTDGTEVARRAKRCRACSIAGYAPPGPLKRLIFERREYPRIVRREEPDLVFSLFGTGLPRAGVPTVVGSAYSNLYYPDIDFWGNWPLRQRTYFRLRDLGRRRRTETADFLIFETDALAKRAAQQLGGAPDKFAVVRPSPSVYATPEYHHPEVATLAAGLPSGFRVLVLTGWHANKGLDQLPEIARRGREGGLADLRLIVTIDADHSGARRLTDRARELGVPDALVFVGRVPSEGVAELYRATNAVLLLSVLESFSNNIVEAWAMRRPLVITDAKWSRDICGPAALYVDRDDPEAVGAALARLAESSESVCALTAAGEARLVRHPSAEQKFRDYVAALERFGEQVGASGGQV